MTPTSNRPLNKVSFQTVAVAVTAIVLALIKNYLWTDMPADLEGPVNTVILALVIAGISGFVGWMTPIAPGEITNRDQRITEAAPDRVAP